MSLAQDSGPDQGGDDIVAAEYVVGVQPADERAATQRRIDAEPGFARLVDRWEGYLAPLAEAYLPVEPPASLKAAIDRRLFGSGQPTRAPSPGLWSSLFFWRSVAFALLAALVIYAAWPYFNRQGDVRLVASLAADSSDVRYLALYDARDRTVSLSHLSGDRGSDRDFELWMIEGKNKPVSIGVLPGGQTVHITLTPDIRAKLAQGAVLAISIEPVGGSPTGQPTGPVVAAGDLKNI